MKRSHALIAIGVAASAIGITSAAFAESNPDSASAPAKARGFEQSSAQISERESDLLSEHAQRVTTTGTAGPDARSIGENFDSARLLLAENGVRVAAVPSDDGGTCYVVTDGVAGQDYRTGCATEFNEYGFAGALGAFSHDNPSIVFAGIVANDVSAITAVLRDGSIEKVELKNNAFAWSSTERPASITFTRAGKDLSLPISSDDELRAEIKANMTTRPPTQDEIEGTRK